MERDNAGRDHGAPLAWSSGGGVFADHRPRFGGEEARRNPKGEHPTGNVGRPILTAFPPARQQEHRRLIKLPACVVDYGSRVGMLPQTVLNLSDGAVDPMIPEQLKAAIEDAWDARESLTTETTGAHREAVEAALNALDSGSLRVAEKKDGAWSVNEWLKKAVLLSFRLNAMTTNENGPGTALWWDKVPSKFAGWDDSRFHAAGFRAVPNCIVRKSAYIAPGVVLMPSFVNLGAYVDSGTMVDTWATIGSCAQIGKNCHISGGAGIGGVLEPLPASPVIIEDNVFIGARAEVAEGVIVEEGSVLSMGVYIGASTKIVDRATGEVFMGRVPAYSVVVSGTMPGKPLPDGTPGPGLYCAVIVKRVDERTRSKVGINELLRD